MYAHVSPMVSDTHLHSAVIYTYKIIAWGLQLYTEPLQMVSFCPPK